MLPLVLYDIPCKLPGNNWSPNPAKPRFVLGYKNLPFETVWVEFPDIAARVKEIGASPNGFRDGKEKYTVPVLSDPNTGTVITDSWAIAEYLDKTYPEKPVFPHDSNGLISAFNSALLALNSEATKFTCLRSSELMSEGSRELFTTVKSVIFGDKVNDWSPEGPKRDAHWESIENVFYGSAKAWYEQVEGKWVMGNTFSYADILLAAYILWQKRVYHADEWKRVAFLHDGKWAKLLEEVEKECNLA